MLVIESIERFDDKSIILRLEDLDTETITRVSLDAKTLTHLVEDGELTIIERFSISYDNDYYEDDLEYS